MDIETLLASIETGPEGNEVVAFFDLDGTVVSGFTAVVFAQERLKRPELVDLNVARTALRFQLGNASFQELLAVSARAMAGHPEVEVRGTAEKLFTKSIAALVYPEVRRLIAAHRRRGHRIVMFSAATDFQVGPVADALGVDDVICNRMVVNDEGILTGEIAEPLVFGPGKAEAAMTYAAEHALDLDLAFFYSDGVEDLPLLEIVGHPQPLNPDRHLRRVATERGWTTPVFDSRGRPTRGQLVRTVLAQSAVIPSVAAGLFAGAVARDKRQALNLAIATWGDFAVALAGVRLDVRGAENLWRHRPAVFVFNHQSNFDGLLLMKLLREDITAVAKDQLKSMPIIGQIFQFGDVIFIDRSDHDRALEAMQRAADTIRAGLSVAIAPEGTRQSTPRLGAFKKGAFHLAREAGVPIVPIVIHNSLDVLPRGTKIMRPAAVRIDVLDPIPTEGWDATDVAQKADEIRGLYLEALGQG